MATERVQRSGTSRSRGQRDQEARSGALAGSGGQMGPGTMGRGRSPCRDEEEEKKRKRNDGQRICTAVARKNDADLSRPRRPWRDNETWASTRQIKRRPPHDVHRGGFRRLEGRGEGQRRCPDRAGQWRQCRGHALDRVPPIRARIGSQPSKNTNGHGSVRTSG